jgi:hypothetical protein
VTSCCEHGNEPSGLIKGGGLLDGLNDSSSDKGSKLATLIEMKVRNMRELEISCTHSSVPWFYSIGNY